MEQGDCADGQRMTTKHKVRKTGREARSRMSQTALQKITVLPTGTGVRVDEGDQEKASIISKVRY